MSHKLGHAFKFKASGILFILSSHDMGEGEKESTPLGAERIKQKVTVVGVQLVAERGAGESAGQPESCGLETWVAL